MKSGAQKRKEKAQQQFQSSAAKSREPTEFFAASITPTKNNSAEKKLLSFTRNYPTSKTKFSCLCCCKFIAYFVKNDII